MKQIALLGECMIELNGVPFGTLHQTFGGDVLNSAVYLARASQQKIAVNFVTALGMDSLSEGMIKRWQDEGIHTHLVLRDPAHQPGLYLIQLDEQGERTFLYWRNDSAARYMVRHPDFTSISQALQQMDVVYLSGISLAILPADDREKLLNLLAELAEQGKTIVFDSNYRSALWESIAETQVCYQKLLSCTSLALVTDDDEENLWGDKSVKATMTRLKRAGVKEAVIKAGEVGCYYQNLGRGTPLELIPTEPVAKVIDTTAAGDAFNAGFLAGYLMDCPIQQAAIMGHRLAGIVIQHKGAIIPSSVTKTMTDSFFSEQEKN
ncbi:MULTISPECIES: sugar kinase [Photorhabdus]|uniref:2-dehydro-3-deoxygluconokinase n=2 Tax=Photorhabdus asymbiotica TaxID=291112 RepID=C7BGP1_PHOAA|nr:sugar kinase [Photorhabdus asymbiotica]RKS54613.1 2-keto-3-deoxygluconate kinase [Photorhabdus asymbiotica]CAQ82220.1 2-dehydro-3-deoxygluconokinase (2-keto-3-deoxygluconokinase) (3-deoxy 2-oxo-d-gluconate kinase) (kdg kinase) [Photorhabdus asymbiotica]